MIINKVTTGFVIQQFDSETGKFLNQEFVAGCECTYEDEIGNDIDVPDCDPYLPFDMVQP